MKHKILASILLSLSLSSCAALTGSDESQDPDYTNSQAVTAMESMVQAHAKTQNADPGPLQTVCNLLDTEQDDDTGTYKCSTYVKNSMVVLYAQCTQDGCQPLGYDNVEKSGE